MISKTLKKPNLKGTGCMISKICASDALCIWKNWLIIGIVSGSLNELKCGGVYPDYYTMGKELNPAFIILMDKSWSHPYWKSRLRSWWGFAWQTNGSLGSSLTLTPAPSCEQTFPRGDSSLLPAGSHRPGLALPLVVGEVGMACKRWVLFFAFVLLLIFYQFPYLLKRKDWQYPLK